MEKILNKKQKLFEDEFTSLAINNEYKKRNAMLAKNLCPEILSHLLKNSEEFKLSTTSTYQELIKDYECAKRIVRRMAPDELGKVLFSLVELNITDQQSVLKHLNQAKRPTEDTFSTSDVIDFLQYNMMLKLSLLDPNFQEEKGGLCYSQLYNKTKFSRNENFLKMHCDLLKNEELMGYILKFCTISSKYELFISDLLNPILITLSMIKNKGNFLEATYVPTPFLPLLTSQDGNENKITLDKAEKNKKFKALLEKITENKELTRTVTSNFIKQEINKALPPTGAKDSSLESRIIGLYMWDKHLSPLGNKTKKQTILNEIKQVHTLTYGTRRTEKEGDVFEDTDSRYYNFLKNAKESVEAGHSIPF